MRKVTTTYFCDKCGKEITEELIPIVAIAKQYRDEDGEGSLEEGTVFFELCTDCIGMVADFINQKPFQTPQKREFDVGKAQALRDAGWTYKAISEEMKCSEQTVWNKLNKKAGDKDAENEA